MNIDKEEIPFNIQLTASIIGIIGAQSFQDNELQSTEKGANNPRVNHTVKVTPTQLSLAAN